MFRNIILVGLLSCAIFVAGCVSTTPNSMLSNAPDAVYTSDKSAHTIAQCIVGKWEEAKVIGASPMANYRPTNNGFRVTLRFDDRLHYMADIDSTAKGSKTKLYVSMSASLGRDPIDSEVANCQ